MVFLELTSIVSFNTTPTTEHEGIPGSYVKRPGNTDLRKHLFTDRIYTSVTLNSFKNGLGRIRMGLLWSSVAKDP